MNNNMKIDKYNLDDEFVKQPNLMEHFTDLLAIQNKKTNDLLDECNKLKDAVKKTRAEVELGYRTGQFSIDLKLTDPNGSVI